MSGSQHPHGWVCAGCGKHVTASMPFEQCADCGGGWVEATPKRLGCDRCDDADASRVLNSEYNRLCDACIDWENNTNSESAMSTDLSEPRDQHAPFTEVLLARADDGEEMIYFGGISDGATSMLRGTKRYHIVSRLSLPEPMEMTEEIVEWAESVPEELVEASDHDLPDDLGTIDRIRNITEWYPPEEAP